MALGKLPNVEHSLCQLLPVSSISGQRTHCIREWNRSRDSVEKEPDISDIGQRHDRRLSEAWTDGIRIDDAVGEVEEIREDRRSSCA